MGEGHGSSKCTEEWKYRRTGMCPRMPDKIPILLPPSSPSLCVYLSLIHEHKHIHSFRMKDTLSLSLSLSFALSFSIPYIYSPLSPPSLSLLLYLSLLLPLPLIHTQSFTLSPLGIGSSPECCCTEGAWAGPWVCQRTIALAMKTFRERMI